MSVNTLFADVSEFQVPVDHSYPYKFLSIRSNDGTYHDKHFPTNYDWAKKALDNGTLTGLIVYLVWRPDWKAAVDTHKLLCGAPPHYRMATMIDVESWGGAIKGNQSAGINDARENLIAWHGGNRKRVIGYGNAGDLHSIWPQRGDAGIVLADYSGNPSFPGKVAHQFGDNYPTKPFGRCDINSADNRTAEQFAAELGLG